MYIQYSIEIATKIFNKKSVKKYWQFYGGFMP